mgnify:CR=1 FL=1
MKKKHLEVLIKVFQNTKLNLAESRMRDTFLKSLYEAHKTYTDERIKILEHLGTKNDDGSNDFDAHKKDAAIKEISRLVEQSVDIHFDKKIKPLAELTTYTPEYGEAELFYEAMS